MTALNCTHCIPKRYILGMIWSCRTWHKLEFCLQHNGKILCQIFVAFKLILCQVAVTKVGCYVEICTLDPKLCTEPPYDRKGKTSQLHVHAREQPIQQNSASAHFEPVPSMLAHHPTTLPDTSHADLLLSIFWSSIRTSTFSNSCALSFLLKSINLVFFAFNCNLFASTHLGVAW